MTIFRFQTTDLVHYGSFYGRQTFEIVAYSQTEAWDKVRKLTSLPLEKVS